MEAVRYGCGSSKKYSNMTEDEVVDLCRHSEKPKARRVVHLLRTYLTQLSESKGFDIDVYPGRFGLVRVIPIKYCEDYSIRHVNQEWLAGLCIAKYSIKHQTKFELVEVERVNVMIDIFCRYYITFTARNLTSDDLKEFRGMVDTSRKQHNEGRISKIFCKLK